MNRKATRTARAARNAPADPVTSTPATHETVTPGEALVIELKAKRQVTRYTVSYKGQVYESPRKALDAAGLTGYKGSHVRSVLKDKPVGTVLKIEGHEFTYSGAPVK